MGNPPTQVVSLVRDAKDLKKPNKFSHTRPDIVVITPESVKTWKAPPFQRPFRMNAKVHEYAELLKAEGGVFPGTPMQIGLWEREKYLVDGQHRKEAFLLSGLEEGIANVVYTEYEDGDRGLSDMADDYVRYNSKLVIQRPDDVLRAIEHTSPPLQSIRKACSYVGYDMIRRGDKAPMVSMSLLLRCWVGSAAEVPSSTGCAAAEVARNLSQDDASTLIQFLHCAYSAWGRDLEYGRLWASLNLSLAMWLYRRLVLTTYSAKSPRLTKDQFGKCLMSLSADKTYLDWLVGRQLTERDRSPAYQRMKTLFANRLAVDMGRRPALPQPAWSTSHGSR